MKPLIPYFIQEKFQKQEDNGQFEAYALFLDLSGFTAMTETLMQRGTEGAEVLSNILNNIFEPLVDAVYNEGGFIPYFAGDAFSAIFPFDSNHIDADKLIKLAQRFIQRFGGNQHSQEFVIKCKIGVAFGEVEWGIVGNENKNFYFRGDAIDQSAYNQTKAEAQQIIFDDSIRLRLEEGVAFDTVKGEADNFYIVLSSFESTFVKSNFGESQIKSIDSHSASSFLPQSVIEFNQSGEFREIVTVFMSFDGVSNHQSLDAFATIVLDKLNSFSGYFKEIDFGDKGGVMLAFFGAPVSYENNGQRALEFALSVIEEVKLALPEVTLSIGVSTGLAYTGIIGGTLRAQYAAVGSRVNLAARLMMKAKPFQIYTDQETSKNKGFKFKYEGDIHYKGIFKEIATYRLEGRKSEDEVNFAGAMVGRQEEMATLLDLVAPITEHKFAGIVLLYGEAGIGKSRITYELGKRLLEKNIHSYIVCQADQILKKPFNPFIYALKDYFEQSGDKTQKENKSIFEQRFEQLLTTSLDVSHPRADVIIRELIRTKSILAGLIGVIDDDDSLWMRLDAKGRYENTVAAIKNFFLAEAMLHPLVIELEDGHWFDNDSLAILPDLVQQLAQFPVFLLVTSRYNDDGTKPSFFSEDFLASQKIKHTTIDLNILKSDALLTMAELRLGGKIDEAFLEFLHRASNGNPFYAEQMLEYFSESALLSKNEQNVWTVKDKTMKLSGSINAVLMARVDRLSYLVKETVKAAAVIGREFEIPVLSEVMKQQDEFAQKNGNQQLLLKEQVQTAEKSQIWWAMNELRYIFKHSLLREAIYEMQLRTRLRALHKLIAEAIEKIYADNIEERYADLAFHYEQADIVEKTVEYLEKAASVAKRNYQNRQALAYYEKLKVFYEKEQKQDTLIKLLLKKGETEQLLGQWSDAATTFTNALHEADVLKDEMLKARSHNALGSLLMLKGEYAFAKKHFEDGLSIFERHRDHLGISKSYSSLGNLNFRQGNYELAKSYFLQSIDILQPADESNINAQVIANLALTYMNLNSYDEGINTILRYLPITQQQNDRLGIASLNTNLGIIYAEKGDYDAALKFYLEGLRISEELGNKLLISIAIGSIGNVYEQQGDFAKALAHYEEDLELTQALGDKQGIAIAYGLLGNLYATKGDFAKAMTYLEDNLALCEALGYQKGIIKALNTMGDICFFQNDLKKSVYYYEKSNTIAKKINNSLLYINGVIELCRTLLAQGAIEKVQKLHQSLAPYLSKVSNRALHFEYVILSATLERLTQQPEKAAQYLQNALELDALSAEEEAAIYHEFAQLYPAQTNWRTRALNSYAALYEQTPKYIYKYKMQQLG